MGWQKIPPTKRQIQKVSYCKARLGSFMDLNQPKYLKEDRKFRPDRPSLGGRVQILRQKQKIMHKFFHFAPRASGNKGKSMCWPDTKISTNEKKRLKRKIDKWYNHHKISNKNITKGEIPMALKNTQRNGPLKNSKKKGYISI